VPGVDRSWGTAFGAAGRFYVWGGQESATDSSPSYLVGDGIAYDLAGGSWSKMPSTGAPSPRRQAEAVWTACDAVVFGGLGGSDVPLSGARFRP